MPVAHGVGRYSGAEAVGLADDPAGEHAAAAAAGHEQVVFIDVAAIYDGIDAGHEVVEVMAGVGVMDQVAELLTVSGAAARVGIKDGVAGRGVELHLDGEAAAVVG